MSDPVALFDTRVCVEAARRRPCPLVQVYMHVATAAAAAAAAAMFITRCLSVLHSLPLCHTLTLSFPLSCRDGR